MFVLVHTHTLKLMTLSFYEYNPIYSLFTRTQAAVTFIWIDQSSAGPPPPTQHEGGYITDPDTIRTGSYTIPVACAATEPLTGRYFPTHFSPASKCIEPSSSHESNWVVPAPPAFKSQFSVCGTRTDTRGRGLSHFWKRELAFSFRSASPHTHTHTLAVLRWFHFSCYVASCVLAVLRAVCPLPAGPRFSLMSTTLGEGRREPFMMSRHPHD